MQATKAKGTPNGLESPSLSQTEREQAMRVGVLQFDPIFGIVDYNLDLVERILDFEEADLVVLPEFFNTGYQFLSKEEVASLAEEIPDGLTTQRLIDIARKKRLFLVGGLAEKTPQGCYDSAVLVGPDGYIGHYRKIHLFSEEKHLFLPGDQEPPVFEIELASGSKGRPLRVRLGLMICFDWAFPEVARILALKGADILCQPANLILPYCQDAMATRALENRVFAITTNRIGSEQRGGKEKISFTGRSQVVNPDGNVLFRLPPDKETLRVVDIDPTLARDKSLNRLNHLLRDRRPELYRRLISG